MVVCARLDEREWWKTLRVCSEDAERRSELGRMQQSRGMKIPLEPESAPQESGDRERYSRAEKRRNLLNL